MSLESLFGQTNFHQFRDFFSFASDRYFVTNFWKIFHFWNDPTKKPSGAKSESRADHFKTQVIHIKQAADIRDN